MSWVQQLAMRTTDVMSTIRVLIVVANIASARQADNAFAIEDTAFAMEVGTAFATEVDTTFAIRVGTSVVQNNSFCE